MTLLLNETAMLSVIGTVQGQQHVHTLHFRQIDAAPTAMDGLIDDWEANAMPSYKAIFLPADSPVQTIRATHVCGGLPLDAPAEQVPAAVIGTRGSAGWLPGPSLLAQVVGEKTAFSGRSRQGRFFIGGVDDHDHQGNTFTIGTVNAGEPSHYGRVTAYLDALAARYFAGVGSLVWKLVVHSPKLASVGGTACQDSSTAVTGWKRQVLVTTMRSRRPGSGI